MLADDGGGLRRLTEDGSGNRDPAWAPDGKRIAFSAGRPGHHDIYVMNGDGSGRIRLTEGAADDLMPAWSPDSEHIAFASNRRGDD